MRKPLVLLVGLLLCPLLAGAESRYYGALGAPPWWLGVGFGGGKVNSSAPAPSADRDALAFSVDTGVLVTPEWGVGLEYGMVAPNGGCGGHHCEPSEPGFAPDFSHWFLIAEHRPMAGRVRLRAGVGVSTMCYSYYKARSSDWEKFLEALLFDDDDYYDDGSTHWDCHSLKALGGSVSIGYQWPLANDGSSVGLQLRGEAANFAASGTAGTPRFRHRAVTLQIQLNLN